MAGGRRLDSVHVTPTLLNPDPSTGLMAHSLRHLHAIGGTDHVPVRLLLSWGAKKLDIPEVWPC